MTLRNLRQAVWGRRFGITVIAGIVTVVIVGTWWGPKLGIPSWEEFRNEATFASEVGIAVFTALVAMIEIERYRQGPEISVIIDDLSELDMTVWVHHRGGQYSENREDAAFAIPVIFSNSGGRSGAVTQVEIITLIPASQVPTIRDDGMASYDTVDVNWRFGEQLYRPVFLKGRPNALSIKDNESRAFLVGFEIVLREKDSLARGPTNHFVDFFRKHSALEFRLRFKATAGRANRMVSVEKNFKVKPRNFDVHEEPR